jgi:predicted enzyme related to lactoylglutathione lyase
MNRLSPRNPVITNAKYVHTNLVSRDWRALARFYQQVFGCRSLTPERHLAGPELDAGTGLSGAQISGVHLRLPGWGDAGPTLEIFEYSDVGEDTPRSVNSPGFAHIAFSVDSVFDARIEVLKHGGSALGDVVAIAIPSAGRVTWCYVSDPEGNVIELQSWTTD